MTKSFGILHLSDRCINKDGKKILKRFTSFDNSIGVLDIKTKRTELHDVYAIINVENKSVEEYLDNCIINNIPRQMCLANWSRYNKNNKLTEDISKIDLTPNRKDLTYISNIISIDPEGSLDIDDALHYEIIDNKIMLGIHIADPTSYIEKNSEFDLELQNRSSSLYFQKETIHMLPEEFSTNIISLREKHKKRAYSLLITFETININDIENLIKENKYSYEFIKTTIIINKNLTYDEANKFIDTESESDIDKLYKISLQLNKIYNVNNDVKDTHDMIALFMIFANNICGIKLKDKLSIVRINRKKDLEKIEGPDNLIKLYENCFQSKAEYIINNKNEIHAGLNIQNYSHFTSPIRRYQDMIIHRLLYGDIYDEIQINNYCKKINNLEKIYKFASNLDKLNTIIGDDNYIELECQIVFIDNDNFRVYYEKKNILFTIEYSNYKLKDIIDKKINFNKTSFEIEKNNITYKFDLFSNIKIKIYRLHLSIPMFKIIF